MLQASLTTELTSQRDTFSISLTAPTHYPPSNPHTNASLGGPLFHRNTQSTFPRESGNVATVSSNLLAVPMANNQPVAQQPHPRSSSGTRPSSRRALTAALELAQEAVRLDTTNDDPIGAIQAYARSVALLSEVMERVMRGEDTNESRERRHGGRRRSVVAKEEEVKRLKSIHDTYADRMNILSDIYNVDPNNPTLPRRQDTPPSQESHLELERHPGEIDHDASLDGPELIGSAMLLPSRESTSTPDSSRTGSDTYQTDNSLPEFEMVHPPSMQQGIVAQTPSPNPLNSIPPANPRVSVLPPPRPPPSGPLPTRPRTGSLNNLPPPAPPPRMAPPPPPTNYSEPTRNSLMPPSTRPRGNSMGHRRTGSDTNRLEALHEEPDSSPSSQATIQGYDPRYEAEGDMDQFRSASPGYFSNIPPPPPRKDTPPVSLGSIVPTSSSIQSPSGTSSPSTPRGNSFLPQPHPFAVPEPAAVQAARSRGVSTPVRSESYGQAPSAINTGNVPVVSTAQRPSKSSTGSLTSTKSSPTENVPPALTSTSTTPNSSNTRLNASSLPSSTASSLGMGRNRSASQPPRPVGSGGNLSEFGVRAPAVSGPPVSATSQTLPRKPSFPSRIGQPPQALSTLQVPQVSSYFPVSPLPPAPPSDPLRKPYHLMVLLWYTMTSKSGGYITRRLHVPHEVWSQGGAKLLNLPEKVRVLEVLSGALEEIQQASNDLTSGVPIAMATPVTGRKEIDRWSAKLDEWNGVCEGIVLSIGKKLGVGEGFGSKKGGWSGKFAYSFNRMTNSKNLDSPASYVTGLTKVFQMAQVLDEHTKALLSSPPGPLYASLSPDARQALEMKFKRSSEFFASVVLTFVIRDLSQLLDKYVKKGEKWLAE